MKNIIRLSILSLAAAVVLPACSDWTEPEADDLRYDTIQEADPNAYAQYLSNLRAYRDNGHKRVYAWFENQSSFSSQAHHVSAVPDSIDVLVFNHPEAMSQGVLDEINTKRSDTGMQMAYVISYAAIRKAWELKKEVETSAAPVKEWSAFMTDSLSSALAIFDNGGFDRVICSYDGRDMSVFPQADRDAYKADQKAFLDPFSAWRTSHIDKGFDFVGIPANLTDMSLISEAGTVFLSESADATNTSEYEFIIRRNSVAGAPVAKFGLLGYLPSLDPTKAKQGFWGADYSSWLMARWARTADVSAIGLYDLADDYYNPSFIYPVTRGAIQRLNPAAK